MEDCRTRATPHRSHYDDLVAGDAQPTAPAGPADEEWQSLHEWKAQCRAAFEHTVTGIAHVQPDGHVLRVNDRLCHFLGYEPEELKRGALRAITHRCRLGPQAWAPPLLGEAGATGPIEQSFIRKDGVTVWLAFTVSLVHNPNGTPQYFIFVVDDITARKDAELVLLQARSHLSNILNGIDAGLMLLDPTLRPVYANDLGARMLGYSSAALLLDAPPGDLEQRFVVFAADDQRLTFAELPASIARKTGFDAEQTVRSVAPSDGKECWWVIKARPAFGQDGNLQYVINTILDITERKQADAQMVKLRELEHRGQLNSEFIAHIYHELRTPLNHIKGYASTLVQRGAYFDEQTKLEFLAIIVDESDQLAYLVADLLQTTQIDSGLLRLDIESVAIDEIIEASVRRWQGVSAHQFQVIQPCAVPPVPADRRRLLQVLDNLLGNVVHHTPESTISTITLESNRDELIVSVSDNGPGIDNEHLPFLFDRSYQAAARSQRRGGHGLGLFICRGIIQQHHGRIWAELRQEGGTTVRFSLPRRHARAAATVRPAQTPPGDGQQRSGLGQHTQKA